jgi:hypothetical protein
MADYGNLSWHVYLWAAYLVTGVGLGWFAWRSLRRRTEDAAALESEGFLQAPQATKQGDMGERS